MQILLILIILYLHTSSSGLFIQTTMSTDCVSTLQIIAVATHFIHRTILYLK